MRQVENAWINYSGFSLLRVMGGVPPSAENLLNPLYLQKFPPVDHHHHPHPFTRKAKEIFSGLIFCGASIWMFEFLNLKIEKDLVCKLRATILEGVYVTIGNPAFFLFIYLTAVHFRGKLQHGGDVSKQKIKCRPIRTRGIVRVSLSDVLYVLQVAFIARDERCEVFFFIKR